MDFRNAAELLALCRENSITISEVMLCRECTETEKTEKEVFARMREVLRIMRGSVREPLEHPGKSMGGLIGGEASVLYPRVISGEGLCGSLLGRAVTYSMGVLEVNASMGLIVAAPTAGSSGVIPGLLLALQEEKGLDDDTIVRGLFNAGAIGYLAMRNATVAGAVGGCQAEIGVASAMAASAVVEMMGGDASLSLNAASVVLMNMLGLVCDPIGGLVECPCQSRNAVGAANALIAAELSLAGVKQPIPFDEMLECMYRVGRTLPPELRETARGGCATTPSGEKLCTRCTGCAD